MAQVFKTQSLKNRTINNSLYMPSNVEASVAQVTVGTVFLILMVIAALVNLSVVMTFYCRSRLHTPTNVLIIGCVFFDVVGVFIGFPFVIVSCFSGHWYFGEEWCKVYGVLMATVGAANISILTAIAVHRYFVMLHRARARSFTNEKAIIVIVVCIGHGLLSGLLPIIVWGNITPEPSGLTCGPDWTNTNMSIRSNNVSFMVVNGLVPLGIICACYTQILIKVHSHSMQAVRLHMASHIAEMQVTTSAFLIIVGFFVSWLPYACFSLWTMFNDVSEMSPTAAIIPPLFAKAAYVWNPLIYFGRNNDFRREFIDALMHSSNEERNVVHMVRLQECRAQEHLITLQEETEL